MSSRFNRSHLSLALMAALASPTLLADALERERDEVPVEATDLPVDGTRQALQLEETRVLGTAAQELKQAPGVSIITAEDINQRFQRQLCRRRITARHRNQIRFF